jgi:hypothetical protein
MYVNFPNHSIDSELDLPMTIKQLIGSTNADQNKQMMLYSL